MAKTTTQTPGPPQPGESRTTDALRRQVVGRRIVGVQEQAGAFDWDADEVYTTLLLDGGIALVILRDEEGNGPGAIEVAEWRAS